jgi:transposase
MRKFTAAMKRRKNSMSNVINLPNKRDWKYHADRINAAWGKQVESILEIGRYLIEAKEELSKDAFEAMCQSKLSFNGSTARRLIVIGNKSVFCAHVHKTPIPLPASWGTLYELSKLDDATLRAKIADGTVHPNLERTDAVRMVEKLRGPSLVDRVRDIFATAKNGLTSDELRERVGGDVAAHTIRGYVSRLAKQGELMPTGNQRKTREGNLAIVYMRNENYTPPAERKEVTKVASPETPPSEPPTTIDPQAQRDEMRRSYVTFLNTLSKEEQVEEIKKIVKRELTWTTKEVSSLYGAVAFNLKRK